MSRADKPPKDAMPEAAPFPFPTAEHHDSPPAASVSVVTETPTEDALDRGIEESFPASDPVSVSVSKTISKHDKESADGEEGSHREQAARRG